MADQSERKNIDILDVILKESDAYSSLEQIEGSIQQGQDLSNFPIQPLYLLLKSLPIEKTSAYLIKFSEKQRKVFLDLDLWHKDELDIESFSFWLQAYFRCPSDEIREEFCRSNEFILFLKAKFNIYTFDLEDPQYPEHDNYFLTEDNLLLFEYEEDYEYVDQVQKFIRMLYSDLGVENAYAHLFKAVSESYSNFVEEEYQSKKSYMRDFGFIDYYDALELNSTFPNIDLMNNFIRNKSKVTGNIDVDGKMQALHQSSLIAFKDNMHIFSEELKKVRSDKRVDYLHFNFIRLINGTLTLTDALKNGSVAMTRTGNLTKNYMILGFNYTVEYWQKQLGLQTDHSDCLFDRFEFIDFYRIGHTLVKTVQKNLKKSLIASKFDSDAKETFLGNSWKQFLDSSFIEPPVFNVDKNKTEEIIKITIYDSWSKKASTLIDLMPFMKSFYDTYQELKNSGKIQDSFYYNYVVDEIDFEAIIISSFANFVLGHFKDPSVKKMGLTLDDFKKWVSSIINSAGKIELTQELSNSIESFVDTYGFNKVYNFSGYLINILKEHLEDYDYNSLKTEDYKHVGGPIILNQDGLPPT